MIARENYTRQLKKRIREQFGWLHSASVNYSNQLRTNANIDIVKKIPAVSYVIQDFDPTSSSFGEFLPFADLGPADSFSAP